MELVRSGIRAVSGSGLKINKSFLVFGVLYFLLFIVVVFLEMSYSKTLADFNLMKNSVFLNKTKNSEIFTQKDISHLPHPVKKYLITAGIEHLRCFNESSNKDVNSLVKEICSYHRLSAI